MSINDKDYYEILNILLEHHEIFYKFAVIGQPRFIEGIPTCCVTFDIKSREYLSFLWNEKFYNKLTNYERAFCIAHECLHVILNHGRRANCFGNDVQNVALDIVVNSILIKNLGFTITLGLEFLVTLEKIFKEPEKIQKNKSFEYYFNLLLNEDIDKNIKIIDHSYLANINSDELLEKLFGIKRKDAKEDIKGNIKPEDIEKSADTEVLDKVYKLYRDNSITNFNWQHILNNIVNKQKSKKKNLQYKANWSKINRRTALVQNNNIVVPSYKNDKYISRIKIFFFQDVSGSCIDIRDKFIKIARSIPEDIFDVRFFTFDTKCREQDINDSEVIGGGGTSFMCIEQHIQSIIKKENCLYPGSIVVITDGASSDIVEPEKPENWNWLLTENNTKCFSNKCKSVVMNNY